MESQILGCSVDQLFAGVVGQYCCGGNEDIEEEGAEHRLRERKKYLLYVKFFAG